MSNERQSDWLSLSCALFFIYIYIYSISFPGSEVKPLRSGEQAVQNENQPLHLRGWRLREWRRRVLGLRLCGMWW